MIFLVRDKKITIIGAGHLGSAIVDALYQKGHRNIIATRRNEEQLLELGSKYEGLTITSDNAYASSLAEIVVLAVKPSSLQQVSAQIKQCLDDKLVLSLAAGKSIAEIEAILPSSRIARVMTGIFVADEIAAYTLGSRCCEEDSAVVKYLFGPKAISVAEELLADRTWIACDTGLLAKGIDHKIRALGIPAAEARLIYAATLQGIARRLQQGETGEGIYRQVAGKSSFTEGLHNYLEQEGYYKLVEECAVKTIKACRQT